MAPRPTIRDVAHLAGVHPATVSRALDPRRAGRITAATSDRVWAAATTLGYEPDPAGRQLRAGRSAAVGVVVPDLTNPIFPPLVQGIDEVLSPAGYVTLIADTGNDTMREGARIAALEARRCDGYIVASATLDDAAVTHLSGSGAAVVLVNRAVDSLDISTVTSDDVAGVTAAVHHLASLGHTAIAHVTGPPNLSVVRTRTAAFFSAAASAGLDPAKLVVRHGDTLGAADACPLAIDAITAQPQLTAILAGNDLMALGCYAALRDAGLRCPDDLSIVGYNDMPHVEWWRPALTTVRIPQNDIGRAAAEVLLAEIAPGPRPAPRHVALPTSLSVRASTARVP